VHEGKKFNSIDLAGENSSAFTRNMLALIGFWEDIDKTSYNNPKIIF
jgi:hypothetical protein